MKRRVFLLSMSALLYQGAQAAAWDDLGGILNSACNVSNGTQVAGVNIDTGAAGENLRWVCQLRSMHAFINDNIVNGDWGGFAKDVIGKYASEYLNYLGEYLGTGAVNAYTDRLSEALQGDYQQFRRAMYGAVGDMLAQRRSPNAGFAKDTAGGVAATAINTSPNLTIAQRSARLQDAIDASAGLDKAYKAKKAQEEALNALSANTAPALATAAEIIGTPAQEGLADRYNNDARTAVSGRELAELQVNMMADRMKQDSTMTVAVLNQLSEIAQQQVLTNTLLLQQYQEQSDEMLSNEEALNSEMEAHAQDNMDSAIETGKQVMSTYANAASVVGESGTRLDFSQVAP